jgi:CheY-like chemotaxis protein
MRRILIIDDETDIREVTAWTLRATTGWYVETAASGSEGIRCATSSCPDAILLDFSMPGMDGPATLRETQCIPALASVPVIFLTARAYSGHLADLGAAGILAKPFDPRTLGRQIASVLCWS